MKQIYSYALILIVSLFPRFVYGQEWTKNLPKNKDKETLTLYDFKKAFNTYWGPFQVENGYYTDKQGYKHKAVGWKQFKRWEYYWSSRVNNTTGEFPTTLSLDNYKKWLNKQPQNGAKSTSGNWQSLGPFSSNGGYAGLGRLNCIAFHPSDTNTYWVGSPGGGLWKTLDDGVRWDVLTDNNEVLGVSDIAVSSDYENDTTLYIATGDKDRGSVWSLGGGQQNDNNSIGVLKSTDGGTTWNTTGLSFTVSQRRTINRLLIDPTDDTILYAATSNGLYKTTDAGSNWNQLTATEYIDLEFKPGTSSTLYASNWNGDIDRSTDSGASFSNVMSTNEYRTELAVSPNNSNVVYAITNGGNSLGGIYKSTDSGASFSEVYLGNDNFLGYECDGSDNNSQGNYDLCIAADPTDANTLFIGGVNTWKSTDGGANWSINTHWSGTCGGNATTVHADKHFLAFQNGSSTLFECNDGGVYKTTDGGNNWSDKTNGIVHSQLYRIGVSQTEANACITGLQDNGSKLLKSDSSWQDVTGGDGMECIIDYTDYQTQFSTYVQGTMYRTTDAWNSYSTIHSGTGHWVTPYVIDPNTHTTLYAGYRNVEKSTDSGSNWSDISSMDTNQKLRSLAVAPSNSNYIYTADPNQLWVTTDGGSNWTERTSGLPVASNSITYIAVKNNDPSTVWVSFGGYDTDRVYQSTDAGANWTNISTGLPDIPVMSVIQNKQNTTDDELYIGTDVGVYLKIGNGDWQAFNSGLPNVLVTELDIYYDNATPENSRLRAGTFGRGLWESDLYTPPAGPMIYDSSTTTQDNTSDTHAGDTNQEIIGIKIETTGNEDPIDVTSFEVNTNGSTDADADIANAKLFYSGTSSTFSTSNQFGATQVNPSGNFTINGTQELSTGTNYFWLTYDIDAGAIDNHVVDAECTSLTVDETAYTPTETAPAGNRKIAACEHCYSWGNVDFQTSTTQVLINGIDNASGKPTDANGNAYSDYTNISTDIVIDASYDLTVQVNTDGNYTVYTKVWIDWNQDCSFDDAGEEYDLGTTTNLENGATSNSPLSITVPSDAKKGNAILRVASKYGEYATSCDTDFDGEVEDYTLNIVFCDPSKSTTWDGDNWSNDPPNDTKPVVIAADYNIDTNSGDISMCSCTINSGAKITVMDKKTLLIVDEFENNGILDVKNNASLLQINDDAEISGNGTFKIERITPTYLDYDYTYWSSPVDNEKIGSVFATNPNNRKFLFNTANFLDMHSGYGHPQTSGTSDSYDDNNDDWQHVYAETLMQPGKGYIAMGEGSPFNPMVLPPQGSQTQTVVFNDGKINNGVISVAVTLDKYNQENADNDPDPYSGADSFHTNVNLIGNPYPSALDIVAFRTDANNTNLLEGTFYIWTHDTAIETGGGPWAWNFTNDDYATMTVDTNGTFSETAAGNGNGTHASRYIASGQGFMANVTDNGNLIFNNAMRVSGENDQFREIHNANEQIIDRIWLNLKKKNSALFRQILIGFYDTATDGYMSGQDGQRMENGESTDFYSLIPNNRRHFAIQNLSTFNVNKTVKLGIEANQTGEYFIALDHIQGVFDNQKVYLKDFKTGVLHDLNSFGYYQFEISDADLGEINNRFEIQFRDPTLNLKTYQNIVSIYPNPSKNVFYIALIKDAAFDYIVYDISGKKLMSDKATQIKQLDLSKFDKGIYFLQIRINDKQITKKLVLK